MSFHPRRWFLVTFYQFWGFLTLNAGNGDPRAYTPARISLYTRFAFADGFHQVLTLKGCCHDYNHKFEYNTLFKIDEALISRRFSRKRGHFLRNFPYENYFA
ncbi:hypothetical protein GGS24DRAFT_498422 [Hypoxylon argillaceum]|nr:hypothetical protein GGS24DRAFT_498422 [Hypoxylon argillaceum]